MPGSARPPASPYVWSDSWYDKNGVAHAFTLTFNFDSPVNGGGTNVITSLDYSIDAQCPWQYIIVERSTDGVLLSHQIPNGSHSGSLTQAQVNSYGLTLFTDIGYITVGANPQAGKK